MNSNTASRSRTPIGRTATYDRDDLLRLRREDPARYRSVLNRMRRDLAKANEREDRPLTPAELETLIDETCTALGWSRNRVLTEGILRLQTAFESPETFRELTPPESFEARRGRYLRSWSSLDALIVGAAEPAT